MKKTRFGLKQRSCPKLPVSRRAEDTVEVADHPREVSDADAAAASKLNRMFEDDPFGLELHRASIFARGVSRSGDSAYETEIKSLCPSSTQSSIQTTKTRPLRVERGTVSSCGSEDLSHLGSRQNSTGLESSW
eukprot:CAMPEP_0185844000 /NCGR_PEP_ID=MMETSP1354-20130828/334_1 /TAXON_ID=708628 /ORGANISM="Erythrolobus madagascarensis, Strain CCMP3276" /LENGTH=132 /DNA_ID=CAMNT_0028543603 /DNA_START=3 /DNA_END=398 /DNA_ORIENTATION=+